jgi:surfactin synthase thioesterase subunit
VKLRGYRIELGEIEACACQFAGINQVVAQAINGQYICLYYSADTDVDVNALKQHLANRLAAYMIPTAYMQLDAMPLNANGKIDRHQLPEPSTIVRTEGLLPQTEKEAVLLLVAQQVLERDDFGITDDLFDLGLTSITAIKVAAMAEAFGMHISVNNLQRLRTIKRVFNIETPIGYWFNNYSPEKPVLISPHGVVPVISMTEKFMVWQEHFSIYTFEPTDEHASRISPNMDYEKLVNAYADLLERDIPTDAHVFGFLGYSWGGELGYSLAARWQERHGGKPNVYLCDTFIFDPDVPKKTEEEISQGMVMYLMTHEADFDMSGLQQADSAQNGDVLNMILMKCGKDAGFAGEVLKIATKKFYYGELYRRVRPLPTTDCRVTYFIATRENPHMEDTLASWQKVAPAMNVIEIDDNHMNFSLRNDKTYMVTKCLLDDLKSELLNKKMSEE